MPSSKKPKKQIDPFANLPPVELLPWENSKEYKALETEIVKAFPVHDQIHAAVVRRIVDNEWESVRSCGLSRSVLIGSVKKALLTLLDEAEVEAFMEKRVAKLSQMARRKIVNGYLGKDAKARAAAVKAIKSYGLSEEEIHARAYLDHVADIETLQGRPGHHDIMRRQLIRDYESLGALNGPLYA